MPLGFSDIPEVVLDYVREVFGAANREVSTTLTRNPALHEESLDHLLIARLTATPPTFFAKQKMAVAIESHWLGGRHMYRRWEIADIAVCIILREQGKLASRKVALLQMKRIYSREISVPELEMADFMVGIGRLIDKDVLQVTLAHQRAFTFDNQSLYAEIKAGSPQIGHIEAYHEEMKIPVYYGLYHPVLLPYADFYPITSTNPGSRSNDIGCRIMPYSSVHGAVAKLSHGQSPSFDDLALEAPFDDDPLSIHGWRLERFVADEVMRCREGELFGDDTEPRLQRLLYARSGPISAAIAVTIDFGSDRPEPRLRKPRTRG